MLFQLSLTSAVTMGLALCSAVVAKPIAESNHFKRATSNKSFGLWAYGEEINGLPVYYGDGLAYIGNKTAEGVQNAVNVTFTPSSTNDTQWVVSANTTGTNTTNPIADTTSLFYIIPDSFTTAGFTNSSEVPGGASTSGFGFFGRSVVYTPNSSNLEAQFWAEETSESGIYLLKWNQDGGLSEGSYPIALKDRAPIPLL